MSLWVDKYRPQSLDRLSYHAGLAESLKHLAAANDLPHLLFYGPPGAGKKTRITCFLREIYGAGVDKLKIDYRAVSISESSNKTVDISTLSSNYHIEVNPSDVGHHDYFVVRELLKDIALTQQLDTSVRAFKVVVIAEADKLTRKAQQALRRIMEKYAANCRYILCCNSVSKVLAPIRSRCLAIRVAAPLREEIAGILQHVAKKESIRAPPELLELLAGECGRNLRRAILQLETVRVMQQSTVLSLPKEPPLNDWERYTLETANLIVEDQTPQRLLMVRGRLYELLSHCIPPDVIFKRLTVELIKNVDVQLKVDIVAHAATYEHQLQRGRKAIYHLEAFVAKFMSLYKKYLLDLMG